MTADAVLDQADLRSPDLVMTLDRLGAGFPTRLSFMRSLLRELAAEGATVKRSVWEIDDEGYGRAVYTTTLGGHPYSLVAFATPLADADRTDRVIATAWDSSYVLFDGTPTTEDLDRLAADAPRQEAARFDGADLILSRANKSVRLFEHVVEELASGRQPNDELVKSVGYLMRTTAVYGNGKFGIADRARYQDRPSMDHPFRAEMLAVWLIRGFTIDLVEHIAARRSPQAVLLDRRLKRFLGIGNATGLGMAPFLVSHPILINNWIMVRETALARVRAQTEATAEQRQRFLALMARVSTHLDQWQVDDDTQAARTAVLRAEWAELQSLVDENWLAEPSPWGRLIDLGNSRSVEFQELMVAAVLEPQAALVDGLTCCMASEQDPAVNPSQPIAELAAVIDREWQWALDMDFESPDETAQFWYVSEDNLEPRIGRRHEEPGADLEQPLDVARRVRALRDELRDALVVDDEAGELPDGATVAHFLVRYPQHRYALRRVQTLDAHPYSEIRDNLIGERCRPIDLLRAKLAFFGASKFDPKSDRWTRVTLYQGAPLAEDLAAGVAVDDVDDWWLPVLEPA